MVRSCSCSFSLESLHFGKKIRKQLVHVDEVIRFLGTVHMVITAPRDEDHSTQAISPVAENRRPCRIVRLPFTPAASRSFAYVRTWFA
jgi:hypothetical protein